MELSCGLPPSRDIVEQAQLAESLGYSRVWTFDSPALYGDMWVALGRVAEATQRIGLGTGVMVPHLRHVMVTASAIATLEELAPGRLVVAVGTGFTARRTLGQPPLTWKFVASYVRQLRALLAGEATEVDGKLLRMIHPAGLAPARPIRTPILIGANGPIGLEVARELGDGVMAVGTPQPGFAHSALLQMGTVLEDEETLESPRVVEAIGPTAAVAYHALYEASGAGVDELPGGAGWRAEIEAVPESERHLHVHEGHMISMSPRDRRHVQPALGASMLTGTAAELREKFKRLEAGGCTDVMYCPAGDIERELRAMAKAMGLP